MAEVKRQQAKRKPAKTGGDSTPGGENKSRRGGARWELMEAKLFEVATQLFAERGYTGTSLQDIADAMGISRPALYYYVKSKDDILARLVEQFPLRDAKVLGDVAAREELNSAEKIRELVRTHVHNIGEVPERFRLLDRNENHLSPDLAKTYSDARRSVLAVFRGVIEDGVASGDFRPVDSRVAALAIIGMCNWVAWWYSPARESIATLADQIAEMAIGTVAATNAAGANPSAIVRAMRQDLSRLEKLL